MTSEQVTRTPEQIARAEARADHIRANVDHFAEADTLASDILQYAARTAAERGLSDEQQVTAFAVATVHLRETFPADKGGKPRFDELAHQAHVHYVSDE